MVENVGVCSLVRHGYKYIICASGSEFFAVSWAGGGTNGNRRNSHEPGACQSREVTSRALKACSFWKASIWLLLRLLLAMVDGLVASVSFLRMRLIRSQTTATFSGRWALWCGYSLEFRVFVSNHLNHKEIGDTCVLSVASLSGRL